jgi:hypothetical protein
MTIAQVRAPWTRVSGGRHSSVVVAVALVRMVQVAFHEIVGMATVRYRFMTATTAMSMFALVSTARMAWGTGGWIRAALAQGMFVHVSGMNVVKMAVVQIIDVPFMLDRGVPATRTM